MAPLNPTQFLSVPHSLLRRQIEAFASVFRCCPDIKQLIFYTSGGNGAGGQGDTRYDQGLVGRPARAFEKLSVP
jgi:hypothetical protein